MKTINYYDLTAYDKEKFFFFLKTEYKEDDAPARVNMYADRWDDKPNTLPYILEKTNRFKDSGYFQVLIKDEIVIGCSGAYTSQFSDNICILGVRTWINKRFRNMNLVRNILLPNEKQYAINRKHKMVILTFNEYNKNLSKIWFRTRLGEHRTLRKPKHFGYNGINTVDFPVNIQYTKQWVIYEKLDPTFDFNWESIR